MMNQKFLARDQFQCLLDALVDAGFLLLGPRVQQGAIVYADLENTAQLPSGIVDIQQPGHYELQQTDNQRFFSWATAAQSIKPLCFAATETLWQSTKTADGNLEFSESKTEIHTGFPIGRKIRR